MEKKFKKYVKIQESGITNMFDIKTVIAISGGTLSKEDCLDIMQNYNKYEKQFSK